MKLRRIALQGKLKLLLPGRSPSLKIYIKKEQKYIWTLRGRKLPFLASAFSMQFVEIPSVPD